MDSSLTSYASVWTTLVALLAFAGALVAFLTARMKLRAARIAWDRERQKPALDSMEEIQKLFDQCECPGANICGRVLCLIRAKTFDQAVQVLEGLTQDLRKVDSMVPLPAAGWLQSQLGEACDGNPWRSLQSPGDPHLVETKVLECYAELACWLRERSQVERAISDCEKWVEKPRREHFNLETVRNLVPALLREFPKQDHAKLIDLLDTAIRKRRAGMKQDKELASAAITVLSTLGNTDSANLLRLFKSGFSIAVEEVKDSGTWGNFGGTLSFGFRNSIQGSRLTRSDVDTLHGHINALQRAHDKDLLGKPEYLLIADILKEIDSLNKPRGLRPANRHVVSRDLGVKVDLAPVINQHELPAITGNLGNFSISDGGWNPGAWITSYEGGYEPLNPGNPWNAVLHIKTPGEEIVLQDVQVWGPLEQRPGDNEYGDRWGYRVKFGPIAQKEQSILNKLAENFPKKR